MTTFETIEIPNDRARERLPIHIEVSDLSAWPGRTLRMRFDWNNAGRTSGRWNWEVRLVNPNNGEVSDESMTEEEGILIPRRPVMYAWPYVFRDYILFMFLDFSRTATRATSRNLGDKVKLVAFPGRESPGYEDWLAEQDGVDIIADSRRERELRTRDVASGLLF